MIDVAPIKKFVKVYKKSDIIFEENSLGSEMYIIHSGKVRLFTTAPGREIMLALLGPGDFFSEMSLADASPRNATAVTEEDDTRLIISNREKFLYLIGQQPAFILWSCHLDIQLCFSYI
jgi:CRP/FNR family cyclic AMP-dependent transcriptional regulator